MPVIYAEIASAFVVLLAELLYSMLRAYSYIEKQIVKEEGQSNLSYY
jgi:hypothetical protein